MRGKFRTIIYVTYRAQNPLMYTGGVVRAFGIFEAVENDLFLSSSKFYVSSRNNFPSFSFDKKFYHLFYESYDLQLLI